MSLRFDFFDFDRKKLRVRVESEQWCTVKRQYYPDAAKDAGSPIGAISAVGKGK